MSDELSSGWLFSEGAAVLRAFLDLGLAGLVGLLAWRLRFVGDRPGSAPNPEAARIWDERERRLREIHENLRRLVGQAQEDARLLDARLAAQVAQVESTLRSAEAVIEAARTPQSLRPPEPAPAARRSDKLPTRPPARGGGSSPDLATRVRALAEEAMSAEEIARQVELPVADVRFLLALGARGASPVVEGAA